MRILVVIANYGMRNYEYAKTIAASYLAMDFDVDVVFLSETPKIYDMDVDVVVGLPSKNPWSLPFAHKKIFSDHKDKYDLFIYSEDDMLITQRNIEAFLEVSDILDDDCIPGFVRCEYGGDSEKSYPDIHGSYHWLPQSARKVGDLVTAQLSNLHSACYILTQKQLGKAIESGGFLVDPHCGVYDMLCSAATDPYTQCGFEKVICISHLSDFEVHHLPNTYVGRAGLSESQSSVLVAALHDVAEGRLSGRSLFETVKAIETSVWDMNYFQSYHLDLVKLLPGTEDEIPLVRDTVDVVQRVPDDAVSILSVGCGSGDAECLLLAKDKTVTAIPLDNVIGTLAREKGIKVLPADFEASLSALQREKFDAVILPGVLQHLKDPRKVLSSLSTLLNQDGIIIGSVPNSGGFRYAVAKLAVRSKRWSELKAGFDRTGFRQTTRQSLKRLLTQCNLTTDLVEYADASGVRNGTWFSEPMRSLKCSDIVFSARLQK